MQVEGRGGVLASSEVKHFAAYTLETNWKHESDGRKGYSANVSAFDWSDSYVVPFAATLGAAGAHSYMCSYNAINGTPSCANAALARLARDHWNMPGFIESDCDAVGELETAYRVADDAAEASALALGAGTDVDCGPTFGAIPDAVRRNLTTVARLRAAFENAMRPLFLAGLFSREATAWDGLDDFGVLAEHRAAAREAADQSTVLLKNEGGALPFPRGLRVALIGPMAEARAQLVGAITIGPCPNSTLFRGGYKEDYSCVPTLAERLRERDDASAVEVEAGVVNFTSPDASRVAAAVEAAARADVVVLALGAGLETVDEKEDLYDLGLPGAQAALASAVGRLGKPTVAVLVMGNQYAVDEWVADVPAVIDAFVPSGLAAADVILDTVFGYNDRFGKLPYTIYDASYADEVALADASFESRGYRYYGGERVTFPFGFGLSYANFSLSDAAPAAVTFTAGAAHTVSVKVSSDKGGEEVIMLFAKPVDVDAGGGRLPLKKLLDFERVRVKPGSTTTVSFTVAAEALHLVDAGGARRAAEGSFELLLTNGNGDPRVVRATVA